MQLNRTPYAVAAVLALVASPAQQPRLPERVVAGNTLRSDRDPAIVLAIEGPVHYLGADRWILYGVADCEVHVFVEADDRKRVTRLYWIQFEGYLPEINSRYDGYNSPTRVDIGGREFIVDGGLFRSESPARQGSDRERVLEIIKSKGYVLPAEMMTRRMVHLPTPDRRKELMIIYAEDLTPTGYAIADLTAGGRAEKEWPDIARALTARAVERISAR